MGEEEEEEQQEEEERHNSDTGKHKQQQQTHTTQQPTTIFQPLRASAGPILGPLGRTMRANTGPKMLTARSHFGHFLQHLSSII